MIKYYSIKVLSIKNKDIIKVYYILCKNDDEAFNFLNNKINQKIYRKVTYIMYRFGECDEIAWVKIN